MEEVKGKSTWWNTYSKYLSSKEWKRKRERVLKRDNGCKLCGSKSDCEVHHRTYKDVGDEDLSDLTTLCSKCHSTVTSMLRRRRKWTKTTTMYDNILTDVPELIL